MLGIGPCALIADTEKAKTKINIKMRRLFISFLLKKVYLPLLAGDKLLIK